MSPSPAVPRVVPRAHLGSCRVLLAALALPVPQVTERVSVATGGAQANQSSAGVALSTDGRFVVFRSWADDLVPGDTNHAWDVFLHDRMLRLTTRVSVDSNGVPGNADSIDGMHSTDSQRTVSADGRFVAFESLATNLVPGDTNGCMDVFVHDGETGATERVSVDSFATQANQESYDPSLSADGRFVAFVSRATNLVPGDGNGAEDVFVRDRATGTTLRVSVDSGGGEGVLWSFWPSISADGGTVAFQSGSPLVPEDHNGTFDVYVHKLASGTTTRVSVDSFGHEGSEPSAEPCLSPDARFVAFTSESEDLVAGDTNHCSDVFLHDRGTGVTLRASVAADGSQASAASSWPSLSRDGQRVVFHSLASDLVPSDSNQLPDVFVREPFAARTERVNVDTFGAESNDFSWQPPAIGDDGREIAFASLATNLVPGDSNASYDVFVRGPELTLDATPREPAAGGTLTLTLATGVAGRFAGIWAVEFAGQPFWLRLWSGPFSAEGRLELSGPVPPELSGLEASFLGFGVGLRGKVVASQVLALSFD